VGGGALHHWIGMVRGVAIVGAGGIISLRKRTDNGGYQMCAATLSV